MNHALETIEYQHQDRFPRDLTSLVQDIHHVAGRGKWSDNTTIIASHPARLKIEQLVNVLYQRGEIAREAVLVLILNSLQCVIHKKGARFLKEKRRNGGSRCTVTHLQAKDVTRCRSDAAHPLTHLDLKGAKVGEGALDSARVNGGGREFEYAVDLLQAR
jgi:hypothetical protein